MRVSKFVKVNKNILLEYIYDTENNIGDSYNILVNTKDNFLNYSYISGGSLAAGQSTNNEQSNQLFKLDPINNVYGLVNTTNYSFLQIKQYVEGFPARHDTIRVHFQTNYTFGEYIGFHIRVYTLNYTNNKTYDLSNFYFDSTDSTQSKILQFTSPPLYFQESVWGKNISINFPSISYLAAQRSAAGTLNNTINFNLTSGVGISNTSPVFIDFHFIRSKKTLNSLVTYTLAAKTPISLPQTPDFEKLGLRIQHSENGDFFEVFGLYNGTLAEFNTFMENSFTMGKKYRAEFDITLYEQNIRGKSIRIIQTENFNERVEYRPIIKFSSTTAIIDVVMNIVDETDGSSIQRRASYGMLQDEVAKYSLSLTKINLDKAFKPKIYNIKSPEGAGIFGNLNGSAYSDGRLYGNAGGSLFSTNTSKNLFGLGRKGRGSNIGTVDTTGQSGLTTIADQSRPMVVLEPIPVDRLVLSDRFTVLAKSESARVGRKNFYGIGKLQIILHTFDNIVQFFIARDVNPTNAPQNPTAQETQNFTTSSPEYLDLSSMGEINMVIKNTQTTLNFPLYTESQTIDLTKGQVTFKIPSGRISDVRKVFDSGINLFYITATNNSLQTVVYSGLFTIFDAPSNVTTLNDQQSQIAALGESESLVVSSEPGNRTGTALVTRRIVPGSGAGGGTGTGTPQTGSNSNLANSSLSQTVRDVGATPEGNRDITYEISTYSSLKINGYEYSNQKLKEVLLSSTSQQTTLIGLSIKAVARTTGSGVDYNLHSSNGFIGLLFDIRTKLKNSLTPAQRNQANQAETEFILNATAQFESSQQSSQSSGPGIGVGNTNTSRSEITFLGNLYRILAGSNNTSRIYVQSGASTFWIEQSQLSALYPAVTNWQSLSFKNSSALYAGNDFIDNANVLFQKYRAKFG